MKEKKKLIDLQNSNDVGTKNCKTRKNALRSEKSTVKRTCTERKITTNYLILNAK